MASVFIIKKHFPKDYPEFIVEKDSSFPLSFGPVLWTTFFVDSDHGYDLAAYKYVTGLLGYIGSTTIA